MENLEKLFDVVRNCESYRINTYLETSIYGYELTIYLHNDFLENTTAILSVLKVLEAKCEIGIKDRHYDNGSKMRVITIKTERA